MVRPRGQILFLVDSLDTLLIMGMREEFEKGKEWVANNLDMSSMVKTRLSTLPNVSTFWGASGFLHEMINVFVILAVFAHLT